MAHLQPHNIINSRKEFLHQTKLTLLEVISRSLSLNYALYMDLDFVGCMGTISHFKSISHAYACYEGNTIAYVLS